MKNVSLLSLYFLFISFQANSQERKFSVGVVGSANYYNYKFKRPQEPVYSISTPINYGIGLRFQYAVTERLSIKTGIMYAGKGYEVKYSGQPDFPVYPFMGAESAVKVNYFDIPFKVSYRFATRNKFSLYASAGAIAGFWADDETKSSYFKSTLFSIGLDSGVRYDVSKFLFLTLEPDFRIALSRFDAYLKTAPTSAGIAFGANFLVD